MAKTGAQSAQKWVRNLSGAVQSVREGVEAVTESPGVKAAEQIDKMAANFQAAIASGKTERRLRGIDLNEWKRQTIDKGIPRIPAGANAALSKVENALTQIIAHAEGVKRTLDAMPSITLEDNIARMVAMVRGMSTLEVTPL